APGPGEADRNSRRSPPPRPSQPKSERFGAHGGGAECASPVSERGRSPPAHGRGRFARASRALPRQRQQSKTALRPQTSDLLVLREPCCAQDGGSRQGPPPVRILPPVRGRSLSTIGPAHPPAERRGP